MVPKPIVCLLPNSSADYFVLNGVFLLEKGSLRLRFLALIFPHGLLPILVSNFFPSLSFELRHFLGGTHFIICHTFAVIFPPSVSNCMSALCFSSAIKL